MNINDLTLSQRLKKLRDVVTGAPEDAPTWFNREAGLCWNIERMQLPDLPTPLNPRWFTLWPRFSGDMSFPVPSYHEETTPSMVYQAIADKYDPDSQYGAYRLYLLDFLIEVAEANEQVAPHVGLYLVVKEDGSDDAKAINTLVRYFQTDDVIAPTPVKTFEYSNMIYNIMAETYKAMWLRDSPEACTSSLRYVGPFDTVTVPMVRFITDWSTEAMGVVPIAWWSHTPTKALDE